MMERLNAGHLEMMELSLAPVKACLAMISLGAPALSKPDFPIQLEREDSHEPQTGVAPKHFLPNKHCRPEKPSEKQESFTGDCL